MIFQAPVHDIPRLCGRYADRHGRTRTRTTLTHWLHRGASQPRTALVQLPVALWEDHHKEGKGHQRQLQHRDRGIHLPDQWAFDQDGKQIRDDLPERRGCGTMSASRHSMFFRHYFHGMWNLDTNKRTQFEGIRSGCWLGLIPAGGMLLAPETSAGCSCTHSIQTSVGYLPRALGEAKILKKKKRVDGLKKIYTPSRSAGGASSAVGISTKSNIASSNIPGN